MIVDIDQAINMLNQRAKHWTLKTENSSETPRRYSCKVWAMGKRFSVERDTALNALRAALHEIDGIGTKGLRLVSTKEPKP